MPHNHEELRLHRELLNLSREKVIDSGDLEAALKSIVQSISRALRVDRASVWFYNHDQSSIICQVLFESVTFRFSSGLELLAKDFPAYFKYLLEERTLPVNDALKDPATREFTECYLRPLNIISLIDAPIRVEGKMVGVVCCEQVGTGREWTLSEQSFVGSITDIIARAIGAQDRTRIQKQLENFNKELEGLVRKRTAELEEQRSRSEYASKMALLGEMAGSIAHEINNPLAIILSSIRHFKKLEKKGPVDQASVSEILEDIESTTLRIDKIVKGLRFFARDSSSDDVRDTSLFQILEDTLALCQEKILSHGCQVDVIYGGPDVLIPCQAVSISQALLNLISNSFDAIKDREEKWIRIQIEEHGKFVWIRVTDSGPGIGMDVSSKMMLPFFTTKPVGKGTGLGLSIVKGIIGQHGGSLTYDDRNENTCFIMKLPKSA